MVKEAKIFTASSKNYFNLVQTDKPIYKPGEKMRFRILTLDHQTKPYLYQSIKVEIVDSNGLIVKTFSENRKSDFGFYKNYFTIPDESFLGNWRIDVQIDNKGVKSSKTFTIKDFKPPPFKLYVETDSRVSFDGFDPSINLKIYAKYPFDKFVKGTAKIYAKVFNKNSPDVALTEINRDVKIKGGTENIRFSLKDDLSIQFVTKSVNVNFKVQFIEENLSREAKHTQSVEVLPPGRYYIKLTKPENIRQGFNYKIDAAVLKLNGEIETTESIPIVMKLKYNYKNGTSAGDITHPQFLKGGRASFLLKPPMDIKNVSMLIEFDGTKFEETLTISTNQEGEEALQVSFEPRR